MILKGAKKQNNDNWEVVESERLRKTNKIAGPVDWPAKDGCPKEAENKQDVNRDGGRLFFEVRAIRSRPSRLNTWYIDRPHISSPQKTFFSLMIF